MEEQHKKQNILKVIMNFHNTAKGSLKGPNLSNNKDINMENTTSMQKLKRDYEQNCHKLAMGKTNSLATGQGPLLMQKDTVTGVKTYSKIEGEYIASFCVGGENRLCLPQLLNSVLGSFSMEEVLDGCSDLHIFFSRSNQEQLQILKDTSVLPQNAQSCGLITKTDAERLCTKLLHSTPEKFHSDNKSANSFQVYHECFGKCKGIFYPELYISENELCVECYECSGMFSPPQFVCHSHSHPENHVCHWGFDSANWRVYLLLAKYQEHQEELIKCLNDMKNKFEPTYHCKRKVEVDLNISRKKNKSDTPYKENGKFKLHPKFRKIELPTALDNGPPKLLNPEKVVPFSEHDRYDRDFVPNVSLAPIAGRVIDDCDDAKTVLNLSHDITTASNSTDSDEDMSSDEQVDSEDENKGLAILHQVMNSPPKTQAEKDKVLKSFLEVFEGQRTQMESMARNNFRAIQELERVRRKKKTKLEHAALVQRELRRDLNKLQIEKQVWSAELAREKHRLGQEIEAMQQTHIEELSRARRVHQHEVDNLRKRQCQYEQLYMQLSQEITLLRGELKKTGVHVADIDYRVASQNKTVTAANT